MTFLYPLALVVSLACAGCAPLAYEQHPETWLCPSGAEPDPYAADAGRDPCTGARTDLDTDLATLATKD